MRAPPQADVPAAVTLHLWGVSGRRVPGALRRMATHRVLLRRSPGLTFGKLLGTGSGTTFDVRDADPRHWAVLAAWDSEQAAARFEHGRVVGGWDAVAEERLVVSMRPASARGRWSRRVPFGSPDAAAARVSGPVAAVTRARLRPTKAATFWRSVPPVAADLHHSRGVRLAIGVGEAPVGVQGTFSLWDSADALTDFAYRRSPHLAAVDRTTEVGWYAEEMFARLAVLDVAGTYRGRQP